MWFFSPLGPRACLPPEHKDRRKKGRKRRENTELRRSLLETFAMVLYLLAFAISTRLPTDTEKQMLSIRLSPTLISLFVERRLCPGELCVHVGVCVYPSEQWSCPVMRVWLLVFKRSLLIILPFIVCTLAFVCVCVVHKKRAGEIEGGIMEERDQMATWSYSAACDTYMIGSQFTGWRNIYRLSLKEIET